MLKILSGFPDNVLAVEGEGEITAADYTSVLVPAVTEKLKTHESLGLLYQIGPRFSGMSLGAMWQDSKLGIGHWNAWGRIAVVTDVGWIKDSVKLFTPLFHRPVRVFSNKDMAAAKAWIVEKEAKDT